MAYLNNYILNDGTYDYLTIVRACIHYRPEYWLKRTKNSFMFFPLGLNVDKEAIFEPIVKRLRSALVPTNDLLAKIPTETCSKELIRKLDSNLTTDIKNIIREHRAKDLNYIRFYIEVDHKYSSVTLLLYDSNYMAGIQKHIEDIKADIDNYFRTGLGCTGKVDYKLAIAAISRKECGICNQTSKSKCSMCGVIYYCSKMHQTQDWKMHKKDCLSIRVYKLMASYLALKR